MGDGGGILVQIPHGFFAEECASARLRAAGAGRVRASAICSCRATPRLRAHCRGDRRAASIADEGQRLLGWRDVPVDNSRPRRERQGRPSRCTARSSSAAATSIADDDAFERQLYILRKVISNAHLRPEGRAHDRASTPCRCRRRTIVYKGMLLADQLGAYYRTCSDPRFESALALVHQRFSTNTFPSWQLAHPYRMVAHNGEINTLRGNVNWMAARQASRRLRRCSATTSRSSGRSPTRASPTPPASTTRSNSWCAAATRSPMP